MAIKRIYVTIEGGWWSFTPKQWEEVLTLAMRAQFDFNLSKYGRQLNRAPSHAVSSRLAPVTDRLRRTAEARKPDVLAYNILDWTIDDWERAVVELAYRSQEQPQ